MVTLLCHQAALASAAKSTPGSTWLRFLLGPSWLPVIINFFFFFFFFCFKFKVPEICEDRAAALWRADFAAYCELCRESVGRCLQGLDGCGGWRWPNLRETHLYSAQGAKPGAKQPYKCARVSPQRTLVHPTERQEQANICGRDDQRTMT